MGVRCCVPNCKNKTKDAKLHRFPCFDMPVYNIWISRVANEKLKELDPVKVNKTYRVCHEHFSNYSKMPFGYNKACLRKRSLPTLNLPVFSDPPTKENSVLTDIDNYGQSVKSREDTPMVTVEEKMPECSMEDDVQYMTTTVEEKMPECSMEDDVQYMTTPVNSMYEVQADVLSTSLDTCLPKCPATEAPASDNNLCTPGLKLDETLPTPKTKKDFKNCRGFLKSVSATRASQLTPVAGKMYRIARNLKKISCQLFQDNVPPKERLRKASEFTLTDDFLRATVNRTTYNFIYSQIKQQIKPPKGRRFTIEDKIFALSLYKNSPKNYRLLERVFAIPSRYSLRKLVLQVPLKCGINKPVMESLKKKAEALNPDDRHCTVMFDELHLSPHLNYNIQSDEIEGFEDVGDGNRRLKLADHALVFMACASRRKWKQPLCFFYVESSMKSDDLASSIKKVITAVQETGLQVDSTVCDQMSTNVTAINKLKQETETNCIKEGIENQNFGFVINGQEIVPVFDVPHLLKGIRNNLLKYDAVFKWKNGQQRASWHDITYVYEQDDPRHDFKMFPKLTDAHIYEDKMKKMKVSHAAQVFSQRVSSVMRRFDRLVTPDNPNMQLSPTAHGHEEWDNPDDPNMQLSPMDVLVQEHGELGNKSGPKMPKNLIDTADFLLFFDKLFDSCNGSSVETRNGKELRCAVTEKSPHLTFWDEALAVLRSIKFLKNGKEFIPPSVTNWVKTIQGFKYLWKKLKNVGFKFLCLRNINQDPIENFFSQIRSHGIRNNTPTCSSFRQSFTSLLINNFFSVLPRNKNCENDECEGALDSLSSFITGNNSFQHVPSKPPPKVQLPVTLDKDDTGVITFVAGHMAKQLFKIIKVCKTCSKNLKSDDLTGKEKEYLNARAYCPRALLCPSTPFGFLFRKYCSYFRNKLEVYCYYENIKPIFMQLFEERDFTSVSCPDHNLYSLFSKYFFHYYLFVWTRNINETLKGLDERKGKKYYGNVRLLAFRKYLKSKKGKK